MGASERPFKPVAEAIPSGELAALLAQPRREGPLPGPQGSAVATARLHGFDLEDRPLLAGVGASPGELMTARAAVPLRRAHVGATVLVLHEDGDWMRPIVVGVLQEGVEPSAPRLSLASAPVQVQVDDERMVLSAEREIVLRCGEASITLTRAGKVIIRGSYILSRSSGYNKIKGAAIDIN